jgi:hypothetical protein
MPWKSVGLMPIDTTDGLMEYAEEMAETLSNALYNYLIDSVSPVVTANDEEKRGGIIVGYYLPGLTTLINEAIADTLGMDDYEPTYMLDPNIYKPRTAERIKSLPPWRPY